VPSQSILSIFPVRILPKMLSPKLSPGMVVEFLGGLLIFVSSSETSSGVSSTDANSSFSYVSGSESSS
jgi:hypothetical protein